MAGIDKTDIRTCQALLQLRHYCGRDDRHPAGRAADVSRTVSMRGRNSNALPFHSAARLYVLPMFRMTVKTTPH